MKKRDRSRSRSPRRHEDHRHDRDRHRYERDRYDRDYYRDRERDRDFRRRRSPSEESSYEKLEALKKKRDLTREEQIRLNKLQRKYGEKQKRAPTPEPEFVPIQKPEQKEPVVQLEPTEDDFAKLFGGLQDFGSTKHKDHSDSAAEATYKQFIQ